MDKEAIATLVSISGVEVLRSSGMLGPIDIRITLFIFVLIDATKLASESICVFPPRGTCLISNTSK